MNLKQNIDGKQPQRNRPARSVLLAALFVGGAAPLVMSALQGTADQPDLENTRITLSKWMETQQLIARERNDWQQGREVLQSRVDLLQREVGVLQERIEQSQASVNESERKKADLLAERDQLKALSDGLAAKVTGLESEVRRLLKTLPDPLVQKLTPLAQRMPESAAASKASVAERYQNVLGILNEINKATTEITVNYETRTLADGRRSEVQVIYIGLAQAYFVSPTGESGIGQPTPDGWKWTPSDAIGGDVLKALEIMQGKHTPAFVPVPVKIQ